MNPDEPPAALLWDEPALPRRGPRPTLSLPAIARAGIELADEGGLAALTMEAVAQRLGLTKMALYRYVPGKAELVALMVETALGAPGPAAARAKPWRAALRDWARELFAKHAAHPWSLEATVGGQRPIGPNEVAWLERALSALSETGLRGADKLDVVVTLIGHVRHLAQHATTGSAQDEERAMMEGLRTLIAGREQRFPALAGVLGERSTHDSRGAALDFGLDCILAGVQVSIASRKRKR